MNKIPVKGVHHILMKKLMLRYIMFYSDIFIAIGVYFYQLKVFSFILMKKIKAASALRVFH